MCPRYPSRVLCQGMQLHGLRQRVAPRCPLIAYARAISEGRPPCSAPVRSPLPAVHAPRRAASHQPLSRSPPPCCRHDLFPPDLCSELEKLHSQAPAHSFRHTAAAVRSAFGLSTDELFEWLERRPLASGSIGQARAAPGQLTA